MTNSTSELLDLARAVLEKNALKTGTARGTVLGQTSATAVPRLRGAGTAVCEQNQQYNPTVPLSQPLGTGTVGHPLKEPLKTGTARGTVLGHFYETTLNALRCACPNLVESGRWKQAVRDADAFLETWAETAHALGWTARDLFGLFPVPAHAGPSFRRLSRYDATGLIWLLRGRPVVALTADEAAIQGVSSVTVYRKHNKPALGPVGDSLDDFGCCP
jgi:hypothetical protein